MAQNIAKQPEGRAANKTPEAALNFLEDRLFKCPCCNEEFYERCVRLNELTLLGHDSDLRPIYSPVDPILYDVVVCGYCGYGSLPKAFANLSFKKAQVIMSQMPSKFRKMRFPKIYTEDVAIIRYKAALMSAMLTREKSGVLACLYMRLAWIYRAIGNEALEAKMLAASLEGFFEAVQKELFPVVDLDEETVYHIMGDFLGRLSKDECISTYLEKAYNCAGFASKVRGPYDAVQLSRG